MFSIKNLISWVNLAVTVYDVSQQVMLLFMGQTTVKGLATAIAKGMVKQAMLNCALKAVLGEAAEMVLKVIGLAQDMDSFVEAVKSGDPERIFVESLRLAVSLFTLKCQCFTGDTLVDTEDGYRRIDEIEAGDCVWAYNSETGECELKEVLSVSVTDTDVIVHVMTSDGEEIRTTMYHPFYVKEEESGKWKAASNLVRGDLLLTENGEKVYVKEVRIEKSVEPVKVYNLEVDELHTYFVAGGVLVHNACNTGSAEGDGSSDTTGNNASGNKTNISKTESPALKNSPYNPDVVNKRIKPDYVPNPAHDASSNLYNPKKTPEPSDARAVYNNAVRGGMGEWYGVNGSGEIYQFFYDGNAGAHFAGIISKQDLARKNSSLIELLGISMKGKR